MGRTNKSSWARYISVAYTFFKNIYPKAHGTYYEVKEDLPSTRDQAKERA